MSGPIPPGLPLALRLQQTVAGNELEGLISDVADARLANANVSVQSQGDFRTAIGRASSLKTSGG